MTFTYDLTVLDTSSLMQARLEISDTDPNDQKLQDEEIEYIATIERDFWGTCAHCCEVIARGLLGKADVRLGRNLYLIQTKTAAQYMEMAKALRAKAMGTAVPWVGGMFGMDKENYDSDESLVKGKFAKDMQFDPWVGVLGADSPGASDLPFDDQ